jgi:hypothetical protein
VRLISRIIDNKASSYLSISYLSRLHGHLEALEVRNGADCRSFDTTALTNQPLASPECPFLLLKENFIKYTRFRNEN